MRSAIVATLASVLCSLGVVLVPSGAAATLRVVDGVKVTAVRTTSSGDLLITHSGAAVCRDNVIVAVPKDHADRAGTTSIALAALLSSKPVTIYLEDSVTVPLGTSSLCTVLGLRILAN